MKTTLTPQQALDSTKRTQYVDKDVLDTWPTVTGKIEFFKLYRYVSAKELDEEYEKRGLVPSPFAMCEQDGPEVYEKEYVATQWKDADGKFCYASFERWCGRRSVYVDRDDGVWFGYWSFSGVRLPRKDSAQTSNLSAETSDPESFELTIEARVAALEAWRERCQQP